MIWALAGNQNSGKTTLFNQLTGSNQHVGNFPGVTVEGGAPVFLGATLPFSAANNGPMVGKQWFRIVNEPGERAKKAAQTKTFRMETAGVSIGVIR